MSHSYLEKNDNVLAVMVQGLFYVLKPRHRGVQLLQLLSDLNCWPKCREINDCMQLQNTRIHSRRQYVCGTVPVAKCVDKALGLHG